MAMKMSLEYLCVFHIIGLRQGYTDRMPNVFILQAQKVARPESATLRAPCV